MIAHLQLFTSDNKVSFLLGSVCRIQEVAFNTLFFGFFGPPFLVQSK